MIYVEAESPVSLLDLLSVDLCSKAERVLMAELESFQTLHNFLLGNGFTLFGAELLWVVQT